MTPSIHFVYFDSEPKWSKMGTTQTDVTKKARKKTMLTHPKRRAARANVSADVTLTVNLIDLNFIQFTFSSHLGKK